MNEPKRVLLVSQNFYPEDFKSNDIAFELSKRGYAVDVLTGIPDYPRGNYYKGYGVFKKRKEKINGVNIYRAYQIPRGKGGWRLLFNYSSFVLTSCVDVLLYFAWKKYDCIIGHGVSPVFQAYPAILLKKLKKIPFYFWVLDLWPDALRSGAGIKNERIIFFVDKLVTHIYKNCDKILVSSKLFRAPIALKGDFDSRIVYFPNWSADMTADAFEYDIPNLPEGFKVMLAGNLGGAQNLEAVMDAAERLKDIEELKWIIIGDGTKKAWVDNYIRQHNMEKFVFSIGRFPPQAMNTFFQKANAMLVTLSAGFPNLNMTVPARLQSFMSAGRPVLAMIGAGGGEIINESDCGYVASAGDSEALADIIRNKVLPDKESFEKKGANGRRFYENNFTLDISIDHLCDIINNKN